MASRQLSYSDVRELVRMSKAGASTRRIAEKLRKSTYQIQALRKCLWRALGGPSSIKTPTGGDWMQGNIGDLADLLFRQYYPSRRLMVAIDKKRGRPPKQIQPIPKAVEQDAPSQNPRTPEHTKASSMTIMEVKAEKLRAAVVDVVTTNLAELVQEEVRRQLATLRITHSS